MRVYLVKYYAYYSPKYGYVFPIGQISINGSEVFLDREQALRFAQEEINDKVTEIKDRLDDDNIREWVDVDKLDDECYGIKSGIMIQERDTEDTSVKVDWQYLRDGTLTGRYVWQGGSRYGAEYGAGYDFRPGDESPEAGTEFQAGAFVKPIRRSRFDDDILYVIASQPTKRNPPELWENIYTIVGIDQNGYWMHEHFHENDLEPYTGDVPENYLLLSKICKNEVNLRVGRLKEIFGTAFTEDEIVKRLLAKNNMTEDSVDTGELLRLMLEKGALDLSNKASWRTAGQCTKGSCTETNL